MNREQRRALVRTQLRVKWLMATRTCGTCDAPICPDCQVHATVCECCGEFNCEVCGAYVATPPDRMAD